MRHRTSADAGRMLDLADRPRRVVSLVPSVTELVCALGAADRLVAVTRYCTDPPDIVATIAKVGGPKNPDCERIIRLAPDVVLVNSEENRREDFDRLTAAGLALFVTFPTTVDGAARSVERLGRLLGTGQSALELAKEIDATCRALRMQTVRRPRVFCPIWRNPWMAFNRDTFAHDLLWCAGGDNVCAERTERYPTVELAEIAAFQPEIILLPSEPYRFSERHRESLRPLAGTPAWNHDRIHFVDGQALSWYGPRTPAGLVYFAGLLTGSTDG